MKLDLLTPMPAVRHTHTQAFICSLIRSSNILSAYYVPCSVLGLYCGDTTVDKTENLRFHGAAIQISHKLKHRRGNLPTSAHAPQRTGAGTGGGGAGAPTLISSPLLAERRFLSSAPWVLILALPHE